MRSEQLRQLDRERVELRSRVPVADPAKLSFVVRRERPPRRGISDVVLPTLDHVHRDPQCVALRRHCAALENDGGVCPLNDGLNRVQDLESTIAG